ncbi:porin family protein [Fibrella sp. WM1]|uniref:porin family protein n=1 Tax=Fibrella musci TaxID=3242485 RepID=UPI0035223764
MNKSILFLALVALPVSLSAQTKSAPRKSAASTARSSANRPAVRRAPANPMIMAKASATPAPAPNVPSTAAAAPAPAVVEKPAAATPATAAPVARPQTKTAPVVQAKAVARSGEDSGFRVGFRAGFGAGSVSGLNAADLGGAQIDPVTGFHAGAVLSFGRRAFTVQPEILYAQYGFKAVAGSNYLQFKFNVIEVPLLLKYTFGQSNARFFVNAGPTATYLLGGTLSVRADGETGEAPIEPGPNDGRVNYGGSLGIGAALQAGPGSLHIEARGTYLTSSDSDGNLLNGKLSVGYLIPIGR